MDLARLFPWVVRAAWAALPFVAGPAFAGALGDRSLTVRTAASVALWLVWGTTLTASLVFHPVSLTVVRVVAPLGVVAAGWSAAQEGGAGLVALAWAALAAVLFFLPETGEAYVNGPAYPNERRLPLRVPGALLLGPLPLAWVVVAGAPCAAVLLLAARQWVAGGAATAVAVAAGWYLGRALHGLAKRWVVFVPAGLVLHDPMSLADPVLFPKLQIAGVDVAPAGTDALDLTQGSPGLALELALREPAGLVLTAPRQAVGPTVDADRVLFTPTRPGRVLAEVRERMRGAPALDED